MFLTFKFQYKHFEIPKKICKQMERNNRILKNIFETLHTQFIIWLAINFNSDVFVRPGENVRQWEMYRREVRNASILYDIAICSPIESEMAIIVKQTFIANSCRQKLNLAKLCELNVSNWKFNSIQVQRNGISLLKVFRDF